MEETPEPKPKKHRRSGLTYRRRRVAKTYDFYPSHVVFLQRKVVELRAATALDEDREKITEASVLNGLIYLWMNAEKNKKLV